MIDFLITNDHVLFIGLFAVGSLFTGVFQRLLFQNGTLPEVTAKNSRTITAVTAGTTLIIPTVGYFVSHTSDTPGYQSLLTGFSISSILLLSIFLITSLLVLTARSTWIRETILSEHHFRTIFETIPEAIIICTKTDGTIMASNTYARTLFSSFPSIVSVPELLIHDGASSPLSLPLSPKELNGLFMIKNETLPRFSVSGTELLYDGIPCIALFLLDVGSINDALTTIRTNELRYHELIDFLPEGVFEIDIEGNFTYVNKYISELLGAEYPDLSQNISFFNILIPQDRPRARSDISAMLTDRQPRHREYTVLHLSGKQIPILLQSMVIIHDDKITSICGIVINLTERKKVEEELQKKEKLESLGILAGGIAHDFNNLLTAIWSGFSILKIKGSTDEEQNKIITEMENAIVRGKDLTNQLLTYAKGGAPVKNAASLVDLVSDTAQFVTRGTNVKCDISMDSSIDIVEIDGTQISQVIQNLLLNAKEAMAYGGTIRLHLQNRRNYHSLAHVDIPRGNYVELTIEDKGSGIPIELQSRICDPFFTTKPSGSGLGLATSYSIVKNHNGFIYFESTVGVGTTFHILLPSSDKPIDKKKGVPKQLRKGKGRILLLDDEPTILSMSQKLLTLTGYSVVTATTSEEAVQLYKEALEKKNGFDLAILDLTIPAGPGGKETIIKIHEFDPDAKAIVSSGYSNDPIMTDYQQYGFKAVIKKPYDIHLLIAVVQAVIDGTPVAEQSATGSNKQKSTVMAEETIAAHKG